MENSTYIQYIFNNGAELVTTLGGKVLVTKTNPSQTHYVQMSIDRHVQGSVSKPNSDIVSKMPETNQYLITADEKGKNAQTTTMPIAQINKNFYFPTELIKKNQ